MKRIIDYHIVFYTNDICGFEDSIHKYLEKGWTLLGPPIIIYYQSNSRTLNIIRFYQAMILEEEI